MDNMLRIIEVMVVQKLINIDLAEFITFHIVYTSLFYFALLQ